MAEEKKFKTKDMIIAIFCTLLAILCIVFYFLPAFTVKHKVSPADPYEVVNYSGWEMTKAVFDDTVVIRSKMEGLLAIKDTYGFAIILSGILMPLSIICVIVTTVFAYLSWLKNVDFKKFCFLFSLCGMLFATITLISTWFVAVQIKPGNNFGVFGNNIKGSMAYASFVSLILAFVVAIIACAYNYFLDNFDDEEEEEDEDDEPVLKKSKVESAEDIDEMINALNKKKEQLAKADKNEETKSVAKNKVKTESNPDNFITVKKQGPKKTSSKK